MRDEKPRLTKSMVKKLSYMASVAKADADAIADDTGRAKWESQDIFDAVDWIGKLCTWKSTRLEKKVEKK